MGSDRPGEPPVVTEQAGDRRPGQLRKAGIALRIVEEVLSFRLQTQVDVKPRPAAVAERLPDEGEVVTAFRRHLAGQQLEQERLVGGGEGVVLAEGQLELPVLVLAVEGLEHDPGALGGVEHVLQDSVGIHQGPGAVDVGAGGVDRVEAALSVRLQQERLQLDAHHRAASVGLVLGDRALQDAAGRTLERLAVRFQIGNHHAGSVGPAFPHRGRVEDGAHVGEALEEAGTRVGVHLPIEAESEGGEAVPGGDSAGEKDLAAGEAEVVGPERADATEGGLSHGRWVVPLVSVPGTAAQPLLARSCPPPRVSDAARAP